MREGLMDDTGYNKFEIECPAEPNKNDCGDCLYWDWHYKDKCEALQGGTNND